MSESSDKTPLNSDAVIEPPRVRWDRRLRAAFTEAKAHEVCSPQQMSSKQDRTPFIKLHRRRIKHYVKRKLSAAFTRFVVGLRDFFIAPIHVRVDELYELTSSQKALCSALETRVAASLDQQTSALCQRTSALEALVKALEIEIRNAQRDLRYLHQKHDESAVKARPVIRRDGAYAVPLADGYIFIPEEEEALLLMYAGAGSGGLEPGTRRVLQVVAEPGGRAVDVGAGVGLHTLALARAVGPSGRVDAFEAEMRLGSFLERTAAVNGFSQVQVHNFAIGDYDGAARFQVAKTIGHSSLYDLDGAAVREETSVQIRRLDSALEPSARIDVMKIDVEAAELDVIQGAEAILNASPECVVVAECGPSHLRRRGITVERWLSEFAGFGFDGYGIVEPYGHLHRIDPGWVAAQQSVNILFVRPGTGVQTRLFDRLRLT